MKTLPSKYYPVYKSDQYLSALNITIATQQLSASQGSCCDAGRYEIIDDCPPRPRWFLCPWGIRDTSPWLQYGDSGFTFATATVHKGKCTYYPEKRLCPIPPSCKQRVPARVSTTKTAPMLFDKVKAGKHIANICMEMPRLTKLGPYDRPVNGSTAALEREVPEVTI